ncbi:MAG: hypothetical protein K1X29_03760 [Bdellovibrionales bacterium]|nr:hypothetical protein [Bdellovibrionales bacterium]
MLKQIKFNLMGINQNLLMVFVMTFFLLSCESQETDDIASAQKCLDGISSANYASAESCMAKISKYNSSQANIIKCSIKFLSGGLTTEKIANAYKKISEDSLASKEATFIAVLALSPSTKATEAQPYCEASGVDGLVYLSNLAVVGSLMSATLPGGGYDPADPNSVPTPAEIATILSNCSPPANCGGNHATIGNSVLTLSESYCAGTNSTSDICTEINSAITGAGGNPTLVSKQLFCVLDNKTYDSMSDSCI